MTARTMSTPYKRYALVVLTAVYMMNLTDRALIMLLLEPIRHDLNLSDSQLGFVTGIAFGLFYATLGVPIARLADRYNRAKVTAWAIGAWSATVMCTVAVTSFSQLVIARMAAAVGEAGCKPPTYSLVGDYFPSPRARTRAMSVYWIGGPLSALFAFTAGAWIQESFGWRLAFFVVGIPGAILAVVVALTIRDPRSLVTSERSSAQPSLRSVLSAIWNRRALRHIAIGLVLLYTMGQGLGPWYAAFLMRTYGMTTGELGPWLGAILGFGGLTGILLGGVLAGRFPSGQENRQLLVSAVSLLVLFPLFVLFLLADGRYTSLVVFGILTVSLNFFYAPTYAMMQRLCDDNSRATTLSVIMLAANLIGMGLGPQCVGITSDLLRPSLGEASLRYAMLIVSLLAVWTAWHFWRASLHVNADLRAREQDSPHLTVSSRGLPDA